MEKGKKPQNISEPVKIVEKAGKTLQRCRKCRKKTSKILKNLEKNFENV